jgi:hypothetical protein
MAQSRAQAQTPSKTRRNHQGASPFNRWHQAAALSKPPFFLLAVFELPLLEKDRRSRRIYPSTSKDAGVEE